MSPHLPISQLQPIISSSGTEQKSQPCDLREVTTILWSLSVLICKMGTFPVPISMWYDSHNTVGRPVFLILLEFICTWHFQHQGRMLSKVTQSLFFLI